MNKLLQPRQAIGRKTHKKTVTKEKLIGQPKIFLIGMPGSGKTYWTDVLRKKIKLPSYDLDSLLEGMEERTVNEIFAEEGEDYFRKGEEKMLRLFSEMTQYIVSTGGGTPCYGNNMEWMNKTGTTIWLDEPVEVLKKRILEDPKVRPLFNNKKEEEVLAFLQQKLNERSRYYQLATFRLSGSQLTEEQLIEIIRQHA